MRDNPTESSFATWVDGLPERLAAARPDAGFDVPASHLVEVVSERSGFGQI